MISLHIQFENFYAGLKNALNLMNGEVGIFASTFAPQYDPMKDNKILSDVMNLLFAVVSAGAFNSWFKSLPAFRGADGAARNGNSLGVAKDTTNAAVGQSLTIYKDSLTAYVYGDSYIRCGVLTLPLASVL
jgi:hypothetical protein